MPFVSDQHLPAHMDAVEARTDAAMKLGAERAERINARMDPAARYRLLRQGVHAATVSKRIFWLRREADLVQQAVGADSACRKGCSHCCNISVLVAEPEAREIARATGHRLKDPPADRIVSALDVVEGCTSVSQMEQAALERQNELAYRAIGTPCPFLKEQACSIYASRPLTCRQHFNLDQDDLLCQLVPSVSVTVPYLNLQSEKVVYMQSMGLRTRLADIRDWFDPA